MIKQTMSIDKKNKFWIFFLSAVISFCMFNVLGAETYDLEKACAYSVRDGLPNVAVKLNRGQDVTVVFIGGSITVGGEQHKEGYVHFLPSWLKSHYPGSNIKVVNAGVSGSGSDYGAKRFERDVLVHNPDLILIEFCVNDGNLDRTIPMEKMIHKAWLKNPHTDILIFYTLKKSHYHFYEKGLLPPSASAHERVAAFYRIPSLGLGYHVSKAVGEGKLTWQEFAQDGVHPSSAGYILYNEAFTNALPQLLKKSYVQSHSCSNSITPNLVVNTKRLIAKPLDYKKGFITAKGEKAKSIYPLPIPGVHWVGEPFYDDADGKTIWRLSWIERNKPNPKVDGSVALDKIVWANNQMTWFEGDKCFIAEKSPGLFRRHTPTEAQFGVHYKYIPVLRFIAPTTGRYVLNLASTKWSQSNDPAESIMAMAVFKFTWKDEHGQLLAIEKRRHDSNKGIEMEIETKLAAGEELVVVPDSDHWRGSWMNMQITVGYME